MEEPTSIQEERVFSTLSIQFPGIDTRKIITSLGVSLSRKTGRIRGVYDLNDGQRLFSLRTSDGRFLPTFEGGRRMLASGYSNNRVIMNADAAPFIARGKSAFCKHVVGVDSNVVPYGEVLLVDKDNELLAVGTAYQPGYAMMQLKSGVAAKAKHSRDR